MSTNITSIASTEIMSPIVVGFVEQYRSFAKQTAQSIIALSHTLVEAKTALSGVEFALFCREVGIAEGGPVFKKLVKIGEMANRFTPVLERLPNSWTTIYKLAALPSDKFDQLLATDVLTPFATAKQLEQATSSVSAPSTPKKPAADVSLALGELDLGTKTLVYEQLHQLRKQFGFTVFVSSTLEAEIKTHMGLAA